MRFSERKYKLKSFQSSIPKLLNAYQYCLYNLKFKVLFKHHMDATQDNPSWNELLSSCEPMKSNFKIWTWSKQKIEVPILEEPHQRRKEPKGLGNLKTQHEKEHSIPTRGELSSMTLVPTFQTLSDLEFPRLPCSCGLADNSFAKVTTYF